MGVLAKASPLSRCMSSDVIRSTYLPLNLRQAGTVVLRSLGDEVALKLIQYGEGGEPDFVSHVTVFLRVQVRALLGEGQPAPLLVN